VKTLFVSSHGDDYCATVLAHGLSKLPGVELVLAQPMGCYDAIQGDNPCNRIVRDLVVPDVDGLIAINPFLMGPKDRDFDLMVVNACFLREHKYEWLDKFLDRLTPNGVEVWVEGWDSCNECHAPVFGRNIKAVFRRESLPREDAYNYKPHSLMMAAPPHWFDHAGENDRHERPVDVFYAGAVMASPERWACLSRMFQTKRQWKIIAASCGISFTTYFDHFRTARLAVCPVGAAGGFDCLRTWEAVSHGCIPVFVGWPNRVREPWFSLGCYFQVSTSDELPDMLDYVLNLTDLEERRTRMLAEAWEWHTTTARAARMLDIAGVKI
jgi:hypothetical protein